MHFWWRLMGYRKLLSGYVDNGAARRVDDRTDAWGPGVYFVTTYSTITYEASDASQYCLAGERFWIEGYIFNHRNLL